VIGPRDVRVQDLPDPDGSKFGVPTYFWGTAPEGLGKTTRQLAKLDPPLRPGNRKDIAGQVVRPRRGGSEPSTGYLYRVEDAVPKVPCHPGRAAGLARGRRTQQIEAGRSHGVELDRPDITDEPVWDGWDGFER
jgi:hypothetical protein